MSPANSVHPQTRAEWRKWLLVNHQSGTGVWLVSYKKATGKPRIEYDEAVEEALCFGWVDSKPQKLDEERAMLWFAPRKPKTGWSALNKQRVERLIELGMMQAAGLAKVEAAKTDGTWGLLDEVETLAVPDDLRSALSQRREAAKNFEAFPRSVKRSILEWIHNAKRAETRAKRVEETAELASRNERANQWRGTSAA